MGTVSVPSRLDCGVCMFTLVLLYISFLKLSRFCHPYGLDWFDYTFLS